MVPRRRPTATLIVLSSILRPREVMGKAFTQAPDSLIEAAKRRALDVASRAFSSRVSAARGNATSVLGSAGSLDSTDLFGH